MAEPRFGQERIANVPPLNLLDALYAQGLPLDYLRQMKGMRTPEITSFMLRGGMDRNLLDRAVRMAAGEELAQFGAAKTEYDRLLIAFRNRGIDVGQYKGPKDSNALAGWAAKVGGRQVVANAMATVVPTQRVLGGFSITDDDRRMVTGFSTPAPEGQLPGVTTTRGIPGGGQGLGDVRVQGDAPGKATGTPTVTGKTPGPTAPRGGAPAGGAPPGGGAPATPPPRKLSPEEIKADIQARYGWGAAFMDIPEVANILNLAANGTIDAEEANRRWLGSDYYRSTSTNQRLWKTLLGTNPGDAAQQLQDQTDSIMSKASTQGFDIDPARARQIAETSKANGWSDQMINAALASEIRWDPDGAKTGTMATLKEAVQNQLVPMSDSSMTQWAQAIVGGSQTIADFQAYLKDQAKSLFPTMANYLDKTPGGTVKAYLSPYSETIAKTLGTNAGDIDWLDPKWYRFVNQINPKTGERGMVDIADVTRYIIADPQYGYDQTTNGKTAKGNLAKTILSDWGFLAGNQEQFA